MYNCDVLSISSKVTFVFIARRFSTVAISTSSSINRAKPCNLQKIIIKVKLQYKPLKESCKLFLKKISWMKNWL